MFAAIDAARPKSRGRRDAETPIVGQHYSRPGAKAVLNGQRFASQTERCATAAAIKAGNGSI